MNRRLIPNMAPELLVSMPTKQLLGRLHALQRCEESAALSDQTNDGAPTAGIIFKNTAEWLKAYADLKAVLATREHVPSAAQRAETRKQRVRKKSNKHAQGDGGITCQLHTGDNRSVARQHVR